jgi:hypothetical protein
MFFPSTLTRQPDAAIMLCSRRTDTISPPQPIMSSIAYT